MLMIGSSRRKKGAPQGCPTGGKLNGSDAAYSFLDLFVIQFVANLGTDGATFQAGDAERIPRFVKVKGLPVTAQARVASRGHIQPTGGRLVKDEAIPNGQGGWERKAGLKVSGYFYRDGNVEEDVGFRRVFLPSINADFRLPNNSNIVTFRERGTLFQGLIHRGAEEGCGVKCTHVDTPVLLVIGSAPATLFRPQAVGVLYRLL
jgi:hypothetical protein